MIVISDGPVLPAVKSRARDLIMRSLIEVTHGINTVTVSCYVPAISCVIPVSIVVVECTRYGRCVSTMLKERKLWMLLT